MDIQDKNEGDEDFRPTGGSSSDFIGRRDPSCSSALSYSSKVGKVDEIRKNKVSELVEKSKKAAFSLWTLLHAKNCRLGVDRCSQPGCSEAKLMYLHHKTCPAQLLEPCPSQHKGCQDSRKLLAHYRRCRDIRARQSQNPTATNKPQQHVCLVCSLVARHAKFTFDRHSSTATKGASDGTTCHYIPSLNLTYDSSEDTKNRTMSSIQDQPRFAFSRRENNNKPDNVGSGFQALQAAVSCAINSTSSPTKLSTDVAYNSNKSIGGQKFEKHRMNRTRAESLHLTPTSYEQQKKKDEKSMSYLYLAAVDNFSDDHTEVEIPENNRSNNSRRRSLSCTESSSRMQSSTGGVNTMLQKATIAEDLQYILGEGS